MISIYANGTQLPSPTAVTASEEIIWSADTGRSASGRMLGDVIAEKQTFDIEWGVLTKPEYDTIRTALASGFHPFTIVLDGSTTAIMSYRGTLRGTLLGTFGGMTYYKDAAVSVIEQ